MEYVVLLLECSTFALHAYAYQVPQKLDVTKHQVSRIVRDDDLTRYDVVPCQIIYKQQRFGGDLCLHLQVFGAYIITRLHISGDWNRGLIFYLGRY
jgi:hypothetical protein